MRAVQDRKLITLPEFLELYPRPEELAEQGDMVEWLWHFDFAADPNELWGHLIDTSRLNRALGLSEMDFEERDGVLYGTSGSNEWVERPWSWIHGQYLNVVRVYSKGLFKNVRAVYHVERGEGATHRLYVYFGWVPRGLFGRLALRFMENKVRTGYQRVLANLVEHLGESMPEPYRAEPAELSTDSLHRLRSVRHQLLERGLPEEPLDLLIDFVRNADDLEAYRIQVRRLAHEWELDEQLLLHVCLHATRVGLLDLSWDVICPHCRGVRDETTQLGDLPGEGICDVCEIDFGTDIDNAVEITFHVHPSIRQVRKVYFCSAEPSTKLHIKVQRQVPPGEGAQLALSLAKGRYRMRTLGDKEGRYLTVSNDSGDSGEEDITWKATATGDELHASTDFQLVLDNDTDEEKTFILEEVQWTDEALRPNHLFNCQEFRDLFSEQYLGADVRLNVGEQTILFSDMVGSTRFYAAQGDPAAFVEVKKHFDDVVEVVAEYHGALVKTIGDACMASFNDPIDAVKASQKILEMFSDENAPDSPIRLRISLNTGPCIAVNLNNGIDYFGGTVNLAAKLQACAESGEVAMAKDVYTAPGVSEYLDDSDAILEHGVFEHSALEPAPYTRWCIHGPRAKAAKPGEKTA
jgi:class 3 adenylate cyclase